MTNVPPRDEGGGVPARRAMVRWAWRLFRREWRQQVLILLLVVVAVAATVVGATVAVNSAPPANFGFGTANAMATFSPNDNLSRQIAAVGHRFGPTDVVENEAMTVPGSVATFDLRAQDPTGPFGRPMLSLLSGRFPGAGEVALTPQLASTLGLRIGDVWRDGGSSRRVVGLVQNPQSLLDEFALVAPGQVTSPTQVEVLFDGPSSVVNALGPAFTTSAAADQSNVVNPETIVLTLATLGMLLIALVSIGGFTVLAQRRLRALGMVEAMGATDTHVRFVLRANGIFVGVIGALAGFVLGLAGWLAWRPHLEQSVHHLIPASALPWVVILPPMVLAVAATFFAAGRPARAVTRVPVVTALSGRTGPPKEIRRSAVPGVVMILIAFFLFGASGASGHGGGTWQLVLAFVALIIGIVLLAPFCLAALAAVGSRAPVTVRLALRDLARYRARSGSALAAIALGIVIAVVICVVAQARYSNVLDYAGPNLSPDQLVLYSPPPVQPGSLFFRPGAPPTHDIPPAPSQRTMAQAVHEIETALGTDDVTTLELPDATLNHDARGRQFSGQVYVATPALLHGFGISPAQVQPNADVLTMRPGLSGVSDLQLVWGDGPNGPGQPSGPGGYSPNPCPTSSCLANPVVQELGALPAGTSAPNTVITEHAMRRFHLESSVGGWFFRTHGPISAAQLQSARQAAAAAGLSMESKNDAPTSSQVIDWATVLGIALALGVLTMSIGLLRSETAGDLRTLTATGASSFTRRSLTAATAGGLALLGAVMGTVAAYVAAAGWFWSNALNGGLSALRAAPWGNLVLIVVAMPLLATVIGWLLAGREPAAIALHPSE